MTLHSSLAVAGKPYGDTIRVWYSARTSAAASITDTLAVGYAVCWVQYTTDAATTTAFLNGGTLGLTVTKPETDILSMFAGVITDIGTGVGGASATAGWIEICPSSPAVTAYCNASNAAKADLSLVNAQWYLDDAAAEAASTIVGMQHNVAVGGSAANATVALFSKFA